MGSLSHSIIRSFLIVSLVICGSHAFSLDGGRRSCSFGAGVPSVVRHPSSCYYSVINESTVRSSSLTIRWSSVESTSAENTEEKQPSLDLHPPTIQAISTALLTRAQNTKGMPLRFIDNGSMEPWEVTLTAGKIAQNAAEEWAKEQNLNIMENEEVMQVMAGRVVAVLTRLEELEEELLNRCCSKVTGDGTTAATDEFVCLGVPDAEINAWQTNKVAEERINSAAAAIDAACLFDATLRNNRARTLLAMFLHEIEGPGLRRNNVVIPCMDVDFLSDTEWSMLFESQSQEESSDESKDASESTSAEADNKPADEPESIIEDKPARPSLHPMTIDAIEEAFRLRAQNSTTSPLRLLDGNTEWFDVQYSIVKFADRFLEKHSPKSKTKSHNDDEGLLQWTQEELQTVGGRIVGVLMRLDDLEWEWNHRVITSKLAETDHPSMIPFDMWKTTLGLHPDRIEQNCVRTLDEALLEETEFARARAEKMLALFLLNIEGPGLQASGNEVPGGSEPDFIEDTLQLELMMPRPRKQ